MNISFWTDEGQINPELFSGVAEKWARTVCDAGLKQDRRGKKKLDRNKITQLRKFYDEALRYKELVRNGESINDVLPYLMMLNAKAAYAEGRELITKEFSNMLRTGLEQIESNRPESIEIFVNFFEAFMGYYKYYESQYK
jgi:CRISPR-associated protein Csm2